MLEFFHRLDKEKLDSQHGISMFGNVSGHRIPIAGFQLTVNNQRPASIANDQRENLTTSNITANEI